MPRGGGFGGGGFRGGSFGGGFRGSRSSFSSSFRPSQNRTRLPFGRTGGHRSVAGGRAGPYSHHYHHRSRHYYRRPWYRRWWYSPWWGYYYRPWYYSPVYVGGGIVFAIILLLIFLPLMGVVFAFPGSSYDASGTVNYRSTETLYFNEYWYEYEKIDSGSSMTFTIQSSSEPVSFAIADHPFDDFPLTTKTSSGNFSIDLQPNYYEYYSIFLRSGSNVQFDFNASAEIDFFIVNIQEFNDWYYEDPTSFYYENANISADVGTYYVGTTEDVYLVWYNNYNSSNVAVDILLSYEAVNVPDFSGALYSEEEVYSIAETNVDIPSDGTWYFFVYFDPMYSSAYETEITFDVTYETDNTSIDEWINIRPTLIFFGVVIGLVIIFAVAARRTQKQKKFKAGAQPATAQTTTTTTAAKPPTYGKPSQMTLSSKSGSTCMRCGAAMNPGDQFCTSCGGKVSGRSTSSTTRRTPLNSKVCSYCGSKLEPIDNFCQYCGTKVGK
ncbi:zinc ribbon domain-containing protein [Promethearchaeum syntrophicum]|uniref:Zinc ribbon domain-containing protein n=1 Tax=Promethearchaeum syntrophicum TaxID=2594042 RepID=A0A5B9DAD5_9ARCH|nr:zinc ribbon domain-containing protein [Candidatus Prometheoarchaeum syntrophicum]QEE15546.1 Double zinc ribbon [Candidatus Prometheoarchaeum syntrophicum]